MYLRGAFNKYADKYLFFSLLISRMTWIFHSMMFHLFWFYVQNSKVIDAIVAIATSYVTRHKFSLYVISIYLTGCQPTQVVVVVVFFINVDLAIFQPYLDLEVGDNQSLKIQVARRGIEPRSSCSASQKFNHSATAAACQPTQEVVQRGIALATFCKQLKHLAKIMPKLG